jgi:hypothetical protein
MESNGGIISTGNNFKNSGKTCPSAILSSKITCGLIWEQTGPSIARGHN